MKRYFRTALMLIGLLVTAKVGAATREVLVYFPPSLDIQKSAQAQAAENPWNNVVGRISGDVLSFRGDEGASQARIQLGPVLKSLFRHLNQISLAVDPNWPTTALTTSGLYLLYPNEKPIRLDHLETILKLRRQNNEELLKIISLASPDCIRELAFAINSAGHI